MANSTIVQIPFDLSDPVVMHRFYDVIVTNIDTILGNRGTTTFTLNEKQEAIDSLNQTIASVPTQSEVQALSNKMDEVLESLRASNIISV